MEEVFTGRRQLICLKCRSKGEQDAKIRTFAGYSRRVAKGELLK